MTSVAMQVSTSLGVDADKHPATDTRYRRLVGDLDWQRLPAAVRR